MIWWWWNYIFSMKISHSTHLYWTEQPPFTKIWRKKGLMGHAYQGFLTKCCLWSWNWIFLKQCDLLSSYFSRWANHFKRIVGIMIPAVYRKLGIGKLESWLYRMETNGIWTIWSIWVSMLKFKVILFVHCKNVNQRKYVY